MSSVEVQPRRARPAAGPLRASLNTLGGTGTAALLTLALLVLGCVFVAIAGPRASLDIRTQAMRRTLAGVPQVTNTVAMTTTWDNFNAGLTNGASASYSLDVGQLPLVRQQLGQDLGRDGLPLGPGSSWTSVTTGAGVVTGAGPRAQATSPPQVEVIYRDTLASQARLVAGRFPRASLVPRTAMAVAVTPRMAARFGLHPGSVLRMVTPANGPLLRLVVTGIIQPRQPRSAFWTTDPIAAAPSLNTGAGNPAPVWWFGSVFTGADEFATLQDLFGTGDMQLQWQFPVDPARPDADRAPALLAELHRVVAQTMKMPAGMQDAAPTLVGSSGDIQLLTTFLDNQAAVQTVLSLLFTGLAVVGLVVLLLAARMVTARRAAEFTLLRARGASLRQLCLRALRDTAVAVVPAALAGAGLAVALTPGGTSALAPWLGGATVLVALAAPAALVALQYRPLRRGRAGHPTAAGKGTARLAAARRAVAEVTLILMAVGGLVLLHAQGLPPAGGLNVYASAAPVLVAIPAALLVMRLYPLAVRAVARLSARRAGVTGFLAAARASHTSASATLPAFALVLALTLAAFAGMVRDTVIRGETSASWQAVGADAVIGPNSSDHTFVLGPAAIRDLAATRGVAHAVTATVLSLTMPNGNPVTVIEVDPAQYAALVASTPAAPFPAAKLARPAGRSTGPAPVLASPAAAAALGTGMAQLGNSQTGSGSSPVRVAGLVTAATPAPAAAGNLSLLVGGTFIVLPSWAVTATDRGPVNLMMITGPGLDRARLAATAAARVRGGQVTFRAAYLNGLASSPLTRGASLGFAAGLAAAAGFSVAVLLLDLALGAAEREQTLARLATMGLEPRQARRLTLLESLPVVLAAALAGAAAAWVLAPLTGSALNLSVFTRSAASVPVRADFLALGLPVAGLIVLAVAVLLIQIRSARQRGVTTSLRLGQ